jgi:hypothetical protein
MGTLAFQDCQLLPQRQIFEGQLSSISKPGLKNENNKNSAAIMIQKPACW